MREDSAAQVAAERLLHIPSQRPLVGLAGVREERLQMLSHEAMATFRASLLGKA